MSFDAPDFERLISNFAAGYLDVPEENSLPPGATPDARNGLLTNINLTDRSAVLSKRPGERMLNPTAIAAGTKVDGLFEFRQSNGTRTLMAVCNGGLYAFDGTNTFALVGGSSPWTAGNVARAEFFRDNAFVVDGAAQKRTDGTTLYDVGQVKPTGVTNMTAVAPSGSGVTGTYEARYTWYDPVMDHESSPSTITATVSPVAQARRHTQPSGSPGAAYTRWRAYVRRTDTNETKFGRVGTFTVGAGTQNEEVIDTARVDFPPNETENDPPPGAWAILKQVKSGAFVGVLPDSSDYYVSRIGDPQSWHPRNVFSVRKGDGESITGVKLFGEDTIIQKPHRSWRLVGDTVPYVLKPMHSHYGGVSQESGMEIDGKFFDWDRERGPYVTDGIAWNSLADGRIRTIVETVNRNAIDDIRCIHAEGKGLVGWAVATGGTTRKRVLLWYHYLLDTWLPPWTGLEYGSFSGFTNSSGATGVYMGDCWGRVFEMFSGNRAGVPPTSPTDSTLTGTVTAATASTLTDSTAAFYTTGSGLAGLPVAVRSSSGAWQWRRILSNTATALTLDTTNDAPWTTTPSAGWEYVIGGLEWYHWTPWFDENAPHVAKALHWLYLQGRSTSEAHLVEVSARFNDDEVAASSVDVDFPTGSLSASWGSAVWGTSVWGATLRQMKKHRLNRTAFSWQLQLQNYYPDEPIAITVVGFSGDGVRTRKTASV